MRKLFTALILLAAAAHVGAAPATAESVERLLEVTRAESMMDSMYVGMEQVMRQSIQQAAGQRTLTPEQQKVLDQLPGKFVKVIREEMGWPAMKPSYIRIYQETFEQEEVDGLIAFYESPVGQSMITKMPLVVQRSMALAQDKVRALMPRMNRMIAEAVRESSTQGQDAAPAN